MKTPTTTEPTTARPATILARLAGGGRPRRSGTAYGAGWLALRRVRANGRILLVAAVNVLLLAFLLCGVAIYAELLAAIQLQAQLAAHPEGGRNVDVAITHSKLTYALQTQEDQTVAQLAPTTLGTFAPGTPVNYVVAQPVAFPLVNSSPTPFYSEIQFEAYQEAQVLPHIQVSAGQALGASPMVDNVPNALVTQQMTQVDGVKVGDILTVINYNGFNGVPVTVRVAGVWAPTNPNDPFWNGATFISNPAHDSDPYIFPVLLVPNTMAATLAPLSPFTISQHWVFTPRTQALTVANVGTILTDLASFRNQLGAAMGRQTGVQVVQVLTGLDGILGAVQTQERQFDLPVDSIAALALGATMLLLALVVQVLLDRDRATIVAARSRAASVSQLVAVYVAQIAGMSLCAVAGGVALALWLVPKLVSRVVPNNAVPGATLSDAALASLTPPQQVLVPALSCLVLAVLVATVVAVGTVRRGPLELALSGDSDRAGVPLWQRLYLDLWLAGICIAGYMGLTNANQLAQSASASTPSATSTALLAAAPLLLVAAGTLLLLRVFTLVARLWMRLALRGRGVVWPFASMWLARGGAWTMLKPLLIIFAMAVVVLTVTYEGSVTRAASAQSSYQAGADVRLTETQTETLDASAAIVAHLTQLPGAPSVMPAWRGQLQSTQGANFGSGGVGALVGALAIDPATWASVASPDAWQPAYTSMPPAAIFPAMTAAATQAASAPTPPGSQDNPIWVVVTQGFAQDHQVTLGKHFVLVLPESVVGPDNATHLAFFTVGAIVSNFPTLDTTDNTLAGSVIMPEQSFWAAVLPQTTLSHARVGPNEYWLGLAGGDTSALLAAVQNEQATLDVASVVSRQALSNTLLVAPPIVGLRALLAFEALAIALLTLLAMGMRATTDVRQRLPQLTAMRLLGVSRVQLVAVLLGEQMFAATFGALAGVLVGAVLTLVTMPVLISGLGGLSQVSGNVTSSPFTGAPPEVALIGGVFVVLLLAQGLLVSLAAARRSITLRVLK